MKVPPIHNYAILQLNKKKIGLLGLKALNLQPDKAVPDTNICLVGNDLCNKVTIRHASISRTDCNALLDDGNLLDFNINYISAILSTTGSSSGSLAVDIYGNVVALQCARGATSLAYLLPVDLL